MGGIGDTAGALRRSEGGYTLIEMLVAVTIGMAVLGAAVTIFVGAIKSEPRTSSKVSAIQQGRVALERITRELRQGLDVVTAGSSELVLVAYVKHGTCGAPAEEEAEPCRVTYNCTAGTCTRTVAEPDGGSPSAGVQVVSGLSSSEVFSYSPSEPESEPSYVGVELSFATQQSADPTVLADGATLRNGGPS